MTRPSQLLFGAFLAALLVGAPPARATDGATAPIGATDPGACVDDHKDEKAERARRQAALDDLGRRLAEEHKRQQGQDGGMNLNRTGANYGASLPETDAQPPASAPPGDTKGKSH